MDYCGTFAPVAKMTTVCIILALTASRSWPLFPMVVKNAFLHGDLQEEVHMRPQPGYVLTTPGLVYPYRHSLYRLKQLLRAWFEKF